MKYSFITRHKNAYPITLQCQVLGVSRNGYYQYERNQANKPEDPEHQEMLEWVEDIAESSGYTYGSRRMKRALNALGYPVSRDKARKLMREAGVKARQLRKYKVTTNSNHKQPVFDNLLNREFDVAQPDQVYASDVTYVWTKEGWLYLAVVIDLCTRQVVGWSMSSRMKAKLAGYGQGWPLPLGASGVWMDNCWVGMCGGAAGFYGFQHGLPSATSDNCSTRQLLLPAITIQCKRASAYLSGTK